MRVRTGLFLMALVLSACSGGDGADATSTSSSSTTATTTTTAPPSTATVSGTITGLPAGDITCELAIEAFDMAGDAPVWATDLPCPSATSAGLDYSVDVPPGEYTLRLVARWGAGPPTLQNYIWYPGTQDHAAATNLMLEAGTERAWSAALSPDLGVLEGSILDALSGYDFGGTTATGPDTLCSALFEVDGFFTGMWTAVGTNPHYRFDGVPPGSYQALFYDCAEDGSPVTGDRPLVVDRWLGAEPFGDVAPTGLLTASYRASANDRLGAQTVVVPAGTSTDAPIAMHTVPTCLVKNVTMLGTRGSDTFAFTDGIDVVITMGGDPAPAGLGSEDYVCDGAVDDPIETPVVDYCIQGGVYLRHGGATRHDDFGFLEDYEVVTGSGQVWMDPQDRPWYQIDWDEPGDPEYGWFAGWFAVETPCPTPTWTLSNDGFGQAEVGDAKDDVLAWLERALGPYSDDHAPLDPEACVQHWYLWPNHGVSVAFDVNDDTFHSYVTYQGGAEWLELKTGPGLMASMTVLQMKSLHPDWVLTPDPFGFGDEWYTADVNGDDQLRFYPSIFDNTVIGAVGGGLDFYCTP